MATDAAASRGSRDKKDVTRFAPEPNKTEKGKGDMLFEGSGTKLGELAVVPVNLNKIDADHDLLKAFHALLYGVVGKKSTRKKNIRNFSGFAEPDDKASRAAKTKKLEAKKWTIPVLKDLCTLLGLEKGGDKSAVIERIVDFLFSPSAEASKAPREKKKKATPVKKRKSAGSEKGKPEKKIKVKRAPRPLSGFMVFSRANRERIKKDEPDVGRRMGELWSAVSDADKEKFKQQGIAAFEKEHGGKTGKKDEENEDDDEEDEDEE